MNVGMYACMHVCINTFIPYVHVNVYMYVYMYICSLCICSHVATMDSVCELSLPDLEVESGPEHGVGMYSFSTLSDPQVPNGGALGVLGIAGRADVGPLKLASSTPGPSSGLLMGDLNYFTTVQRPYNFVYIYVLHFPLLVTEIKFLHNYSSFVDCYY